MALRNSAIQLTLKARDLLSRIVRKSGDALEQLEEQAKGLKSRFKTLEQQSRLLASFKSQASTVQQVGRAYRVAKDKVEQLAREQASAVNPSKLAGTTAVGCPENSVRVVSSVPEAATKAGRITRSVSEERAVQPQPDPAARAFAGGVEADSGISGAGSKEGAAVTLCDEAHRVSGSGPGCPARRVQYRTTGCVFTQFGAGQCGCLCPEAGDAVCTAGGG